MPVPDTSGVPPFADFEMLKNKLNEIVQKYNNLLVNMDSLNVVSLTADHIDSGTLNAGVVTVRADLNGGAYIQIDSTGGLVINDGTKDTFHADISGFITMVGALVQSATGYPRVVMDPSSVLFGAYQDANNSISVVTNTATGAPGLQFTRGGAVQGGFATASGGLEIRVPSGGALQISGGELHVDRINNITDGTQTIGAKCATNLTYDSTTKNLKLWSLNGTLLAQVTLS